MKVVECKVLLLLLTLLLIKQFHNEIHSLSTIHVFEMETEQKKKKGKKKRKNSNEMN